MTDRPWSLADIRRDYATRAFDERTAHPDPLEQFRTWFGEAVHAELLDVNAMALATITADGRPAVRTVLAKGIAARGIVFFSHYVSPKGDDLGVHPEAAVVFYWAPL